MRFSVTPCRAAISATETPRFRRSTISLSRRAFSRRAARRVSIDLLRGGAVSTDADTVCVLLVLGLLSMRTKIAQNATIGKEMSYLQSPIKSRRAPWRDRFCGLEGLARSRRRVFGHLLCLVFARRESCNDRVQLARVGPLSRGRGLSLPLQAAAADARFRMGSEWFCVIRPVHARARVSSRARRGSSPAPRLRRPAERSTGERG